MKIEFENVDDNRVHTTQGPMVRFDFVLEGGAAFRSMLTVSSTHIGYSTKDGPRLRTTRKLTDGGFVHPAEVMATATEVAGRGDYNFLIAINGVIVVRARGQVPDAPKPDFDDRSFQLRVL